MLQVVQYQKSGDILVEEFPAPSCLKEGILVRNAFSLISAGTEKTSVTNAQSSLYQRAKKQPEQVQAVMNMVRKEGLMYTIKKVQSKLDSYKMLGYSTAGIVIESQCDEFAVGDRVACGGAGFANHAEVISVPKNLAVKIPDDVTFGDAAYTTVGSIALQGVRQADIRLGETVAVIGLGLIGQITIQLLKASGCRVIGLDINESLFDMAKKFGCDAVFPSSKTHTKSIRAFTRGIGCDAVLITAGTQSNEPLELSLAITKKKGKIVVVGDVRMHVPRSPFYEKELELTISCSYGPGRYDPNYELLGNDYPAAYVRWTENRNMQAFLDLISNGKLDVKSLTTHVFEVNKAEEAYNLITGKIHSQHIGVLLSYPERDNAIGKTIRVSEAGTPKSDIKIGFIGAGIFAQASLLPPLSELNVELAAVTTATPANAVSAAKRYGFKISSTDSSEIIRSSEVNAIFCATKHDTHAKYVIESVMAGKPVFVEKPLAATPEELEQIEKTVELYKGNIMVGFNRRFSKSFEAIAEFFKRRQEPMTISYRVNAGTLPRTYWLYQPEQGSGRIVGEACHFIDTMVYLTGALPVKVYAEAISSNNPEIFNQDNVVITIRFSDGSVGSVNYFANGDSSYPKEYCEVFCEGGIAVMNNFKTVELSRGGKVKKLTFDGKKGHKEEVVATIDAIRKGKPMPIPYAQLIAVTKAAFAARESLMTGLAVRV